MVRVAVLCLPGRRLIAVFLPSSCCFGGEMGVVILCGGFFHLFFSRLRS